MAIERLQKILAYGGVASRRAAERLILEGRVRVNGKVVSELGAKADSLKDKIEVDGDRVNRETLVYLVLHKPRGVVATLSDPEGRPTVKELLSGAPARVYPVGRLDFATSGVLLITNDGAFAEGLMHPKKAVPKTYVLKVHGTMNHEDLAPWRDGVRLDDGLTLPAKVSLLRHETDKTWLELTIREGRNQQIRRMGDATGFPVRRLARTSFAGITAEGLRPGAFRMLTRDELQDLKKEYGVPQRVPHQADVEAPRTGRGRASRPGRPSLTRASEGARRPRAAGARTRDENAPSADAQRVAKTRESGPGSARRRDGRASGGGPRASSAEPPKAPKGKLPPSRGAAASGEGRRAGAAGRERRDDRAPPRGPGRSRRP